MPSNDVVKWALNIIAKYPFAKACDIYKILYQIYFGPAHILRNIESSRKYLDEEFDTAEPENGDVFESIDTNGEIYWLHIRRAKAHGVSIEDIWSVFSKSAEGFETNPQKFRQEWLKISESLKNTAFADDLHELDNLANSENPPAVHHSESFNKAIKPNYRIVNAKAIDVCGGILSDIFQNEIELKVSNKTACRPHTQSKDVQKDPPAHPLDIDRVGIEDLRYPVIVLDRNSEHQGTVAKITMSVDLPAKWRGTHMSRFLGVLNKFRGEITYVQIRAILEAMRSEFEARAAHFRMEFPYFIEKSAPLSGEKSLVDYTAIFDGELDTEGFRFRVGSRVPITTLCPCSKELCEKSAHSQRATVEIDVLSSIFIWLEEIIALAEKAASAPVYSLLKRPDEKFVTELAYSNPRFVEDVARQIAQELSSRAEIEEFRVKVTSEESIHNHSAFATIEGGSANRK